MKLVENEIHGHFSHMWHTEVFREGLAYERLRVETRVDLESTAVSELSETELDYII